MDSLDFFVVILFLRFANPLVFGDYPDTMKKNAGTRIPTFTEVEKKVIKGSSDFFGVNQYSAESVKDNQSLLEMDNKDFYSDFDATVMIEESFNAEKHTRVNPTSLQKILEYFKHEYGNPSIDIHENGKATLHNSSLNDTTRVDDLMAYMGSLLDAVRNGSNTNGYFVWPFIDVLELSLVYNYSIGLHYVDFNDSDFKRVPKLSAHWYSNFLQGKSFMMKLKEMTF